MQFMQRGLGFPRLRRVTYIIILIIHIICDNGAPARLIVAGCPHHVAQRETTGKTFPDRTDTKKRVIWSGKSSAVLCKFASNIYAIA